jgi:excisionase family DNA binding protein
VDQLFSVKGAASRLNCGEAMLRKWMYRRWLPTVRVGRLMRVRSSDLETWVQRGLPRRDREVPMTPGTKSIGCRRSSRCRRSALRDVARAAVAAALGHSAAHGRIVKGADRHGQRWEWPTRFAEATGTWARVAP